ncbi:hypothetical protein WJX77_003718 [Trebouxia sp. C0004]
MEANEAAVAAEEEAKAKAAKQAEAAARAEAAPQAKAAAALKAKLAAAEQAQAAARAEAAQKAKAAPAAAAAPEARAATIAAKPGATPATRTAAAFGKPSATGLIDIGGQRSFRLSLQPLRRLGPSPHRLKYFLLDKSGGYNFKNTQSPVGLMHNPTRKTRRAKDPRHFIPWFECSDIFIPINLKEAYHWVAAHFSFAEKRLTCYDSLIKQGQQGQHDEILKSLKRWLTDLAVADKQPQLLPIIAEMEIRYESAAPMQGATVDCGLFVIGYAIAKLRGLPLQLFDQANMPAMREALAENLLRLGTTTTVEMYVAGDLLLSSYLSSAMPSGASVVSPETAAAAQTLLQCHDNPVRTGHARRRSEAKANLEPYVDCMANQYNKSSKVQMFEVGEHVGLHIPKEIREKMDPRFVVCMVIRQQRLNGYKLRCTKCHNWGEH